MKKIPTALTKSIIFTVVIDVRENSDVASLDISNAFIQMHKPLDPSGEMTVMKVRKVLVGWLIEINPIAYSTYLF